VASAELPVRHDIPDAASRQDRTGQSGAPDGRPHLRLVQPVAPRVLPEIRVESEREIRGWTALVFVGLSGAWILSNAVFWAWWLTPDHVASPWLFALFTVAFGYDATFLPSTYLYYVGQMRRPRPVQPQPGLKVALITLCVPSSESLGVIVRQLEAMSRVEYPHESWILDEGGDPTVRAAAQRLGVRYFSRAGISQYNQPGPPFKAKTKAGNVNAWLDAHGSNYDFFVQFDIDHLPEPDYLDRVLGYFRDPKIGWVQGPSLYGNLNNWVARGSAEQELVLQGPLQQGFFGATETPFIIGSHCSYRTAAIREIGGFQPTRAEDHLDTVILASRGYRGVFVPEVLATGHGPDTFETYLRQQFAWAYSMMQVLSSYTPRLIWKYRPLQALQFLFAQTWYPLWSAGMAILFFMPMLSLLTGQSISTVSLLEFAAAWAPMNVVAFVTWWWTRRWHRPVGLRLSWRGVVLHVARWPIVLWALVNVVLRIKHPYMITPKGDLGGVPQFSVRSQALYLALVWIPLAIIAGYQHGWWGAPLDWDAFDPARPSVDGAILLTLWGIAFMALVVLTNVGAYLNGLGRAHVAFWIALRAAYAPAVAFLVTVAGVSGTLFVGMDQIVSAATTINAAPSSPRDTGVLAGRALLRQAASEAVVHRVEASTLPATATALPATATAPTPQTEPLPVADPLPPATASARSPDTVVSAPSIPPDPGSGTSAAVAVVSTPSAPTIRAFDLPDTSVAIGMYDPWQAATDLPLDLEHWYIRQDEPLLLQGALNRTRDRRIVLVTVEPFPQRGDRTPVLDTIVAGNRDGELRKLARVAREASPQVVLLRWAHEMELSGLYPWAANHPELYQAAYRHVVELFRAEGADNVRWVWSPVGNVGLEAYYPGDDVVDYVGVTVLGDPGWDANFGLAPQSFAQLLEPKYERLAAYGKPIVVAEFGVSGPPERQQDWLQGAARSIGQFPLVRALSYFNDVNAENNHLSSRPDWRLGGPEYAAFLRRVAASEPGQQS
jgi:cellulose synthase (UDP-forming)